MTFIPQLAIFNYFFVWPIPSIAHMSQIKPIIRGWIKQFIRNLAYDIIGTICNSKKDLNHI